MLAIDFLAVDDHVKDALVADDRVYGYLVFTEFLAELGRQTGGLWGVVSNSTVGDLDFHHAVASIRVFAIRRSPYAGPPVE